MLWWLIFFCFASVRFFYCLLWFYQFTAISLILAFVEGYALLLGFLNAFTAKERWSSASSLGVPFSYFLGAVFLPKSLTSPNLVGMSFSFFGLGLTWVALFSLGCRFSIGCPSFVSLVDCGLYSFVRHPQALGRLFLVLGVFVQVSGVSDLFLCLVCFGLVFLTIISEESCLCNDPDYVGYMSRVQYRLFPGVW